MSAWDVFWLFMVLPVAVAWLGTEMTRRWRW